MSEQGRPEDAGKSAPGEGLDSPAPVREEVERPWYASGLARLLLCVGGVGVLGTATILAWTLLVKPQPVVLMGVRVPVQLNAPQGQGGGAGEGGEQKAPETPPEKPEESPPPAGE
jgi:hypothetical protein